MPEYGEMNWIVNDVIEWISVNIKPTKYFPLDFSQTLFKSLR